MKRSLIIINTEKEASKLLAKEISDFLTQKSIHADLFEFNGFAENRNFKGYDFVVTLGGDGTVLFAARSCIETQIPLFPVNLGEFGFIASIQPDEWKSEMENFLSGNSVITERCMIQTVVTRGEKEIYSSFALNDVVISAKRGATVISLQVKYDGVQLCNLKSDGLIVSTSTGSTAYSAAAGGPIVDPELSAFVVTPINSFSLSSRPIVLSPKGVVTISFEKSRSKDVNFTVDGQEPVKLEFGDVISIRRLAKKIKLAGCSKEKFYNALRSKLNWSGGPHA